MGFWLKLQEKRGQFQTLKLSLKRVSRTEHKLKKKKRGWKDGINVVAKTLPDPASIRQMEQESLGLTERCYCCSLKCVLTRQRVQLFGEGSHNDVVLHDVRHLLLEVLLVECDQGIRAGIPNLEKRFSLGSTCFFLGFKSLHSRPDMWSGCVTSPSWPYN